MATRKPRSSSSSVTHILVISCTLSLLFLTEQIQAAQIPPPDPSIVDCPFCADPDHVPQSPFSVFRSGNNVFSCQTAFELGVLRLPEENCTFWQNRGATICECASEPPPKNNCTLCEDGSTVPEPRKAGLPGKLCAQLEVEAIWDDPENCPIWQQTVGVYCGCGNPQAISAGQEVCRICGEGMQLYKPLLEVPLLTDSGEETSSSCGQLEFEANLLGANCDQYQVLYSGECCGNEVIEENESVDEDWASATNYILSGVMAIMIVLLSSH